MKTRGRGSSSKSVKSQQETLPVSVPTATPSVPASIPAVSPTPGRHSKTSARKKVLALSGPISSSVLGASSKGVTFPNLDAEQIPASTVSLASPKDQIKVKPALATSQSKSISTEDVSAPSDHDSESSLSPDVLTPKAKGKRKSKVVESKKGKKAKVTKSKGTSSISDSSPLSRFKLKAKINPPPCTSSEDVSPETEDSQPELDPSLTEPNPEVPLDNLAEETDSEEDPSEASPVASDPKGTTPLAFPELSSKLAKQKGAPARTSGSFKAHSITFCFNDNEKNMQFYDHRHFISERNFLFAPHRVVNEFYANLNDELLDQSSFMFHKVYVRGHWYNFSPSEITKALNLVPVEIDDSIEFAKDQVLSELKSHETLTTPLVGPTYTVKDDHAPSTARKVKGINLASPASGNVVTDTPAVPTDLGAVQTGITSLSVRFSLMEETQRQILASLTTLHASSSPAP
ncbi:flocculation protein FLO11-like [Humulus lupulus]|uniref:flocculation protein FLO11-like n=1 Tax=Humulus lupulus TaxID=3486 RepID=UPI002B403D2A|nr:flocculation protein FLO11-like [Humulus lupulus]